ncbi:hypothetical protein Metev_0170 [Methanohalobium evestigatum Z-7303]|uniref:Uncharacterized protein n=1 Tax=Methanohalobium evestigatum (strain ATCC BAA-1072 / DSM 3721 / NBRC 107634 / OCM 161 / Z-7303) TaxID=644295 RepID=D7E679_METEZ|nr:hypothetical protein [Methanohalobium evestigatum]ADI73101.1 hypothetical protein Metev_0170 [Methanohalobium evestigatum Z-7303]
MECEICGHEKETVIVPSKEADAKPINCCKGCALESSISNVFYDGFPVFHFKSENGRWYYVFVDHNDDVPYIYPYDNPKTRIRSSAGEIVFKSSKSRR